MTDGPGFCSAGLKKASKERVTHRQFLKVRGGTSGLPRPIPPSLDQMVCTVVFFAISSIEHRSSSIAALRGTPLTLRCSISSSVDNSMCSFVKVKAPPPPRLKAISYMALMNLMNPMNSKTWNLLNGDNAVVVYRL